MKLFKNKKIYPLTIIIAIIFTFLVGAVPTINETASLGSKIKVLNEKPDNTIIAVVNDEAICQNNLDIARENNKYTYNMNQKNLEKLKDKMDSNEYDKNKSKLFLKTDKELLSDIIKNKIIAQENSLLGITVSNEEAITAIQKNHNKIDQILKDGTDQEKLWAQQANDVYNAYVLGLGISIEEYQKTIEVNAIKISMNEANLKTNYIKNLNSKNISNEEINNGYNEYLNKLVEKSNIIYK